MKRSSGPRQAASSDWASCRAIPALALSASTKKNQVVGLSRGGPYLFRAFIWQSGGVLTDLNTLTVPGSPFLLYANDINDAGEIAGQAFDPSTSEAPAFVAFPVAGQAAAAYAGGSGAQTGALPERLRQQLQRRPGLDPFGIGSGQK